MDKLKDTDNTIEGRQEPGRILRLKQGYNPNSSSIGTIVFAIPTLVLALPAIFGAATAVILAALPCDREESDEE